MPNKTKGILRAHQSLISLAHRLSDIVVIVLTGVVLLSAGNGVLDAQIWVSVLLCVMLFHWLGELNQLASQHAHEGRAVPLVTPPALRIGDQQSNRVGTAVNCGQPAHQRPASTNGAIAGSAASSASASSPNGFTPGPLASECAISTCRHLTRSGMPPPENVVPNGSIASRSARYDSCARL